MIVPLRSRGSSPARDCRISIKRALWASAASVFLRMESSSATLTLASTPWPDRGRSLSHVLSDDRCGVPRERDSGPRSPKLGPIPGKGSHNDVERWSVAGTRCG
jgi:hypothetical protein